MRYNFERNIMTNKLTALSLFLCLFALSGCISNRSYLEEECENGICTSDQEYREVCTETPDGFSVCEDSTEPATDINYTRTQADFRKYGERTPRDHRITQAGAGNNISASVPPSIDNEVVDYEAEVMERDGNAAAAQGGNYAQGGRNAAYIQAQNQQQQTTGEQPSEETKAEEEDQNKDWLAEEGQSLKELLTQWSEESGWRLIWKTNRNYTLNAGAMFRGNFADVSSALVRAFARARPAPVATFYKGNRVLVIETMEDENAYD
ncbi:MAG: toxin co-regulated pilus biosynthesis Q family protein [Alphaproteobacteria bacterium]|nr:toxin co-regulated pilus biosynthesis Q family protein [Alphaproteobacteria bacterium]